MREEIYDDDVIEVEDYSICPECYGPGYELGQLGNTIHFRCRHCGLVYNDSLEYTND